MCLIEMTSLKEQYLLKRCIFFIFLIPIGTLCINIITTIMYYTRNCITLISICFLSKLVFSFKDCESFSIFISFVHTFIYYSYYDSWCNALKRPLCGIKQTIKQQVEISQFKSYFYIKEIYSSNNKNKQK